MSDQANESANQSSDQQTLLPSIVYPTKFTWHYEGKVVHLCGSFTNWLETVPMRLEQSNAGLNTNESMISGSAGGNNNNVFSVVCNLPSGYHQYKFIVDGEWRHDENLAFIQDPLGNVNNWLFVKKPGGVVAGAAQAAVVSQAMSAGFGAVGWDGQQSGMMIGGASSRPVPVAGVHNNANVNIGQQQQQQQGGEVMMEDDEDENMSDAKNNIALLCILKSIQLGRIIDANSIKNELTKPHHLNAYVAMNLEHNLICVSKLYKSITLVELSRLLKVEEKEAERKAIELIVAKKFKGVIDQEIGLLTFETHLELEENQILSSLTERIHQTCDLIQKRDEKTVRTEA